jgi:hypothetical protein
MSTPDRDAAIFAILSGVHQRLQAEMRTVEGLLRMVTATPHTPAPQNRALTYLGADENQQPETESK